MNVVKSERTPLVPRRLLSPLDMTRTYNGRVTPVSSSSSSLNLAIGMGNASTPRTPASSSSSSMNWTGSGIIWRFDGVAGATRLSLFTNVALFVVKIVIAYESRSLVVIASAIDSALDIVSQFIVWIAMQSNERVDKSEYPIGKSRLEPIGIVVMAALMGYAALQVIWESLVHLYMGVEYHERKPVDIDWITIFVILIIILSKTALYFVCVRHAETSSSMAALAEDHKNDVFSNAVALVAAGLFYLDHRLWFVDPLGAIAISVYIVVTWVHLGGEQASTLVGRAAHPEFLKQIQAMGSTHHPDVTVDVVRAYHFGPRFLVELEIVMPRETTLIHAHDVSLELQKKIERLAAVERCHVHVDYASRDEDEHKETTNAAGDAVVFDLEQRRDHSHDSAEEGHAHDHDTTTIVGGGELRRTDSHPQRLR